MTIIEDRLNIIETIELKHGKHDSFSDGVCLLEAAAWLAGEPHSDHPECVCPVLGAFGRAWNDALDTEARNRILLPFLPRLIGTRSTPDVQDTRAFLAADWAVRTYTPAWLRLAGLEDAAAALESLPPLGTVDLCQAAMPSITATCERAAAARAAAWDAAGAAAGAAAWDAAWDAAGAAAGDAAWAAARAAAWAAAWDAAGAAAGDAAWAAARDRLAPTVELLQRSAADLFARMIDVAA